MRSYCINAGGTIVSRANCVTQAGKNRFVVIKNKPIESISEFRQRIILINESVFNSNRQFCLINRKCSLCKGVYEVILTSAQVTLSNGIISDILSRFANQPAGKFVVTKQLSFC